MNIFTSFKKTLIFSMLGLISLPGLAQKSASHTSKKTVKLNSAVKWLSDEKNVPGFIQAFQENKGQFSNITNNWKIEYAADYQGTYYMFTDRGLIYVMPEAVPMTKEEIEKELKKEGKKEGDEGIEEQGKKKIIYHSVTMEWSGASSNMSIEGEDKIDSRFGAIGPVGASNKGYDNINGYKKLVYHNVYPGIDVEFTFNDKKGIEYAVKVKAGSDASLFKMKYGGQSGLFIDDKGDVHLKTPLGDIVDHAPASVTQSSSQPTASFVKAGKNEIGFSVTNADSKSDLTIDPWIVTPTSIKYIPYDCGMDALDNVYVLGSYGTSSSGMTMYVQKYTTTGALSWTYTLTQYATGSGSSQSDIVVDPSGNSYVASPYSYTNSSGFQYAMIQLTTGGTVGYFYNTYPGTYTVFETWNEAYSCNSVFVQAGSPTIWEQMLSTVNLANGTLSRYTTNTTIGEIYAGCIAPNGNYYGLSANPEFGPPNPSTDQLVCYTISPTATTFAWSSNLGYAYDDFQFKSPYGIGTNGITASCSYLYTSDGHSLDQRDLTTGALIKRVIIPFGDTTQSNTGFSTGVDSAATSGLAVDLGCGNVYVGSNRRIYVYDENLNMMDSLTGLPGQVFDVRFNNGMIAAVGSNIHTNKEFVMQFPTMNTCDTTLVTSVNATCGNNNGSATANPLFCGGPFTYLWSNGDTTAKDTGLGAGTYTVTIGTLGSCLTVQDTVSIGVSGGINIALSSIGSGTCSSNITATVTGSSGPFTYLWSNGATTSSITGVPSGTYTVIVKGASGCSDSASITANIISGSVASTSYPELCHGGANGSAVVTVTGSGPYTYKWVGSGSTTDSIGGLSAGTYTCIVTDNNGCKDTIPVTVTQPSAIRDSISKAVEVSCNGGNNGMAINGVKGGTSPYTYLWSNTQTSDTAKTLTAGNYTVTTTDKNGCTATATVTITQPPAIKDSLATVNVQCFGGSNGTITDIVSGGTPAYTYSWTPAVAVGSSASGLSVGTYTVKVTDANGCTSSTSVTITQPTAISATMSSTPSNCDSADGSAMTTASGGTSPYTYAWSPSGGTSSTAPNLKPGTYTVTITDKNGCSFKDTITVKDHTTPSVTVTSGTICRGDSVVLTASGSANYQWSNGATGSSIKVTPDSTTTYTVTADNGCVSKATSVVTVNFVTTTVCCDDTIVLGSSANISATGGAAYVWSPSGNLGCYTCPATTATPSVNTTYTVTVTGANGCTTTGTVTIDIECSNFIVPNVFTPNGDHQDDVFLINANTMSSYSIEIFDRWGVLMYKANSISSPWDGKTMKGEDAPDGVYYYIIKAKCGDSNYNHDGFVQIIR